MLPKKESYTTRYFTKVGNAPLTLPQYGKMLDGTYTYWNGIDDVAVSTGNTDIIVVGADEFGKAMAGGSTTIVTA